jgi:hypothetical protein
VESTFKVVRLSLNGNGYSLEVACVWRVDCLTIMRGSTGHSFVWYVYVRNPLFV